MAKQTRGKIIIFKATPMLTVGSLTSFRCEVTLTRTNRQYNKSYQVSKYSVVQAGKFGKGQKVFGIHHLQSGFCLFFSNLA